MAISVGSSGGRKTMSEINITPFTDVCLVLLIIFMVTTTFGQPQGRDVKLPQARKAGALPTTDIVITLARNGALYIGNDQVQFGNLYNDLKARKDDASKKGQKVDKVIIKADQGIQYDQVVKAMDAVRESGLSYMSLAVQEPDQSQRGGA